MTAALLALTLAVSPARAQDDLTVRGLVEAGPTAAPSDLDQIYGRRVALVVGISRYQDPTLDLASAERDARAVAQLLRDEYAFEQVELLLDAQASREGVLSALSELTALEDHDALLIYWAGHGTTAFTAGGEQLGYLLPWDGAMDGPRQLVANISMEELRALVGRAVPARHKLLVVDACYSGLLTLRDVPELAPHDAAWLVESAAQPVFQIITAGQADQTVLDQGPDGHSVFTGHFLSVLRDTDDYVTGSELGVTLQRRVRADAYARGSHLQTPAFGRIAGTGDFVFVPTAEGAASSIVDAAPPSRRHRSSRSLSAGAVSALVVGAAGLGVAAGTRQAYLSGTLEQGERPGLYRANQVAAVAGWTGVGLSAALGTAAVLRWEW